MSGLVRLRGLLPFNGLESGPESGPRRLFLASRTRFGPVLPEKTNGFLVVLPSVLLLLAERLLERDGCKGTVAARRPLDTSKTL